MVPPEHRRQGVGTGLLDHLAAAVRADGRTELLVETSYSFEDRHDHPYRRFAEKNGFQEVNVEVVRVLQLPVDDGLLGRLESEAAPHHEGYRLETVVGEMPDAYLPSYCRLQNQLGVDAPTGEVDFEEESMTPETLRETEKRFAAVGTTRVSTLALLGDDEVVAYTDLVVKGSETRRVNQWGTLVHRDHRGHRLGTAVKVANLRELRSWFPERTEVVTSNAEVNQNMVDINDRLGFTPVAVLPMFRRFL
jgi:GNAT superfamily N-acetyltransferase